MLMSHVAGAPAAVVSGEMAATHDPVSQDHAQHAPLGPQSDACIHGAPSCGGGKSEYFEHPMIAVNRAQTRMLDRFCIARP